jgi:hypothetical protein
MTLIENRTVLMEKAGQINMEKGPGYHEGLGMVSWPHALIARGPPNQVKSILLQLVSHLSQVARIESKTRC